MTAGIPGTGITAIFYVLLVVLMPVHELFRTVRGQSSWKRWGRVAALNAMVYLAAGLMWVEGWLLAMLIQQPAATSSGTVSSLITRNVISVQPLEVALFTLLTVITMVQFARALRWLLVRRQSAMTGQLVVEEA